MRFHKPPSTGWYSKQIENYCIHWLSKASINATMMRQTRFREWYRRDYPKNLNPVMHGFLHAFEIEKTSIPLEDYCLLRNVDEMEALQPKFPPLTTRLAWGGPGAWRSAGG